LQDRRGLLHARHRQRLAQARALRHEVFGLVLGVDRAHEMFERLQRDPIALFELRKPAIADRDAQDMRDQRFVAERCSEPGHVVIAPGDRHVRLMAQQLDHAIPARPAVDAIAGDDDFADR
jgi:hypothetical protein